MELPEFSTIPSSYSRIRLFYTLWYKLIILTRTAICRVGISSCYFLWTISWCNCYGIFSCTFCRPFWGAGRLAKLYQSKLRILPLQLASYRCSPSTAGYRWWWYCFGYVADFGASMPSGCLNLILVPLQTQYWWVYIKKMLTKGGNCHAWPNANRFE